MSYENLIYEKSDHIALITLNRPERLNALSRPLQLEMLAACAEAKDDDDVWAVIWTGAGRGFCSGADIAVQQGSASDLTLSDGARATYIEGSWSTSGSQIVWGADGSQTLVFDRDGLRTIIRYLNGPRLEPGEIVAIAEGMTPAPSG